MWQLNNRLFEELAMDVYDEVDRRENDAGEPYRFFYTLYDCLPGPVRLGFFPFVDQLMLKQTRKM